MQGRIMNALHLDDVAKLLLRWVVGGLMLFHGFAKLVHGIEFVRISLEKAGLPIWLSPGVFIGEILAPIMLILGFGTRLAALILIVNMAFTIHLSNQEAIYSLDQFGGWAMELNVFYLVTSICILLLGGGRFSLKRSGILS
ncbi:MAG: DoxX family protein [Bdellovibrionia bacterium]